jgi:hypothetical protein
VVEAIDREQAFVRFIFSDPDCSLEDAAVQCGYRNLTEVYESPNLQKPLRDFANMMLMTNLPKAAKAMQEVMLFPDLTPNPQHKLKAATEIMDRVGLAKQDRISVETKAQGIVILPVAVKEPDEEETNQGEGA